MSVGGPSALGTLLVQRLDAALGTTLSQQANLVTGARPDAVTQAANPERADAARTETQRHPREVIDRATAQAEQQGRGAVDKARLDARTAALLLSGNLTNTATTPSAPTTLGQAARTILALLANYPEQAAAVQGKQPLLQARPNPVDARGQPTGQGQAAMEGAGQAGARGTGLAGQAAGSPSPAAAGPATANTAGSGGAAGTGGPGSAGVATANAAGTSLQAAAAPAQLAQALAQALQTSGMFYESHLSNLAFGKQNLAQLMLEPQAQAGRAPSGAQSHAPAPAAAGEQAVARVAENTTPAAAAARAGDAGGIQPGGPAAQASAHHASALLSSGMDPQTHLLVRQQLEVLANQTFAWRGEAWPDAPMEWEIGRRHAQDGDASPQTEHWATRINIHLPALGQVRAQLTLAGQQLVMHLVAPDSAGLLGKHTEALRGRYSVQGLQLSQLSIASEETNPGLTPIPGVDAGEEAGIDPAFKGETQTGSAPGAEGNATGGGAA